jgi:hypothetical protein
VRHHAQRIDDLAIVMDRGNKPVFVAGYVEHRDRLSAPDGDNVGMREFAANVTKISPIRAPRDMVPAVYGRAAGVKC